MSHPTCPACRAHEQRYAPHCIVPPYLVDRLAHSPDESLRRRAIAQRAAAQAYRDLRETFVPLYPPAIARPARPVKDRRVYDARGLAALPGRPVRREDGAPTGDPAADEAYEHAGSTWDFYWSRFARDSLDDRGMPIVSSVHVGDAGGGPLDNAFWNGRQMAYGDGDGVVFQRFTRALEVVGHELTHGVQAHASNLAYRGESGALNEHFADVFGVLIRQWKRGEPARDADWVIGREVLVPLASGEAARGATRRGIRDMLAPGTAFGRDPHLGDDPQPAHMRDRYRGELDHGGVHLNSGIPNRAFALAAIALGGNAWETAGRIWYDAMCRLRPAAQFDDAAGACVAAAAAHGTAARRAVEQAWHAVGVTVRMPRDVAADRLQAL